MRESRRHPASETASIAANAQNWRRVSPLSIHVHMDVPRYRQSCCKTRSALKCLLVAPFRNTIAERTCHGVIGSDRGRSPKTQRDSVRRSLTALAATGLPSGQPSAAREKGEAIAVSPSACAAASLWRLRIRRDLKEVAPPGTPPQKISMKISWWPQRDSIVRLVSSRSPSRGWP